MKNTLIKAGIEAELLDVHDIEANGYFANIQKLTKFAELLQANSGNAVDERTERFTADDIFEQAQVYASAWSLVGGPFDFGDALEEANNAKQILRNMIDQAITKG